MFNFKPIKLSGCFELQPKVFDDARGRFVKVIHEQATAAQGLATNFAEEYYSVSLKTVIRGCTLSFRQWTTSKYGERGQHNLFTGT
jgi:dTDP-4-dehydrorhamnose 3,5-epimerase